MEPNTPDPGPAAHATARITMLEQENEALRIKYAEDIHACNKQVRTLKREAHTLQQDYESLRLQKGGFGFKMLLLSGFFGFVFGLVACYLFFRPTDAKAHAFEKFQRDHQFSVEFDLSNGHYGDAEKRIRTAITSENYQPAREVLRSLHQIVVNAERGCSIRDTSLNIR